MKPHVLLVDGDPEVLPDFRAFLAECTVLVAADGVGALEQLARSPVDVVVTDVNAAGCDGRPLLGCLQERYPDVPAVALADPGGIAAGEALRVDAAVCLPRNVEPAILAGQVRQILARQADGGTVRDVGTASFLLWLRDEQRTCVARLADAASAARGAAIFRDGELLDARVGERRGEAAARELLGWRSATVTLEDGLPRAQPRRIRGSLEALVLDAARRCDEAFPEGQQGRHPRPGDHRAPLGTPQTPSEGFSRVRDRLERAFRGRAESFGVHDGSGDAEPFREMETLGEVLGVGSLLLAWAAGPDGRSRVLLPGDPLVAVSVDPRVPRDVVVGVLAPPVA